MGMYDNIHINVDMLPIEENYKKKLKKVDDIDWQTKSMERLMTHYQITDKGELWEYRCTKETVPKEERPYPDADENDILSVFGCMRDVNQHFTKVDYHGIINFYTPAGRNISTGQSYWYEFNAYFIYGKLDKIEIVEIPGDFIEEEIKDIFE